MADSPVHGEPRQSGHQKGEGSRREQNSSASRVRARSSGREKVAFGVGSVGVLEVLLATAFLPWLTALGVGMAVALATVIVIAVLTREFHDLGPLIGGSAVLVAVVVTVLSVVLSLIGVKEFLTGQTSSGSGVSA